METAISNVGSTICFSANTGPRWLTVSTETATTVRAGPICHRSASSVDEGRSVETATRMVIDHHNGAIEMAREVQRNGGNPDVKKLAADIEKTQHAEVATLQKLAR